MRLMTLPLPGALVLAFILSASIGTATAQSPLFDATAWMVSSDQDSASFGNAVASLDVNGDGFSDLAVAERGFDNGEEDEGRVLVYLGSLCGLSMTPIWSAEGNQISAAFGNAVANAGDVNGDGYDDLLIGAQGYDNGQTNEGRVYLYFGGADGPSLSPWITEPDVANSSFGRSVGGAGDVNDDTYDDIVVLSTEGCYLYLGSAGGPSTVPSWSAAVPIGGGMSQATGVGDVNGDGYDDIAFGRAYYSEVRVYHGSAQGLSALPAQVIANDQPTSSFGNAVASAGDVNGDGFDDMLVGAWYYMSPSRENPTAQGRAYLYLGSASGLLPTPAWTADGRWVGEAFAASVAGAGDVNGDGLDDVLVGTRSSPWAYLYLGTPTSVSQEADWSCYGYSGLTGLAVGAGDFDGDGLDDVVIADPVTAPWMGLPCCGQSRKRPGQVRVYSHASYDVSIAGTVLANGSPLANVTLTVYDYRRSQWATTDADGHYAVDEVRAGPLNVSVLIPLGFAAVPPDGGTALVTLCRGENATLDFALESMPSAGQARGVGYWKHQANVHVLQRGSAQESYNDMNYTYISRLGRFSGNHTQPIDLWALFGFSWGTDVYTIYEVFNWPHNYAPRYGFPVGALQEYLAFLLNVVSNKLQTLDVVSADGATVSQAVQHIAAMLLDEDLVNDEAAKDLAEAINSGREIDAGLIDVSLPIIPYAPRPTPAVGPLRVTPNPMVKSSALEFEMTSAGETSVRVFDVAGRLVRTLVDEELPNGRHTAVWDGRTDGGKAVANGVYFYRIDTPDGLRTARFVVMHE